MAVPLAELLRPSNRARWRTGVVTAAPGTGVVTVAVDGGSLVLPHSRSYQPAVNDMAIIALFGHQWIVMGAFTNPGDTVAARGTTPPAPSSPPPSAPKKTGTTRVTKTFLANSTASYRGGDWRSDRRNPVQGDYGGYGVNTGCWFYGGAIASTLKGATVVKAEIRMRRVSGGNFGSEQATLWRTPHKTRPGGAPTRQGSGETLRGLPVNTADWLRIPDSMGQQFSDGNSFGMAVWVSGSTPYIVFANLGDARSSGAIRLTYVK